MAAAAKIRVSRSLSLLSTFLLLSVACCEVAVPVDRLGDRPNYIPEQTWAYVNVRTDAYMFWWLYGCNNASLVREERPLVVWLQVGEGW